MIAAAVRPVDLVEVDIIRLQAPETCIESVPKARSVEVAAAADMWPPAAGGLGGQDDIAALSGFPEPGADEFLGPAIAVGTDRRRRIEFGRIEEIDAGLHGAVHLSVCFGLRILRTPGHGAEADFGYGNVRASQSVEFHEVNPVLEIDRELKRDSPPCKCITGPCRPGPVIVSFGGCALTPGSGT